MYNFTVLGSGYIAFEYYGSKLKKAQKRLLKVMNDGNLDIGDYVALTPEGVIIRTSFEEEALIKLLERELNK